MAPRFAFPTETLEFLADLGDHNSKTWFDANRPRYEAAYLEPAKAFVETISPALEKLVPGIRRAPSEQFNLPHQPRHPVQQGRDPVQGPRCTPERSPTTSTSRPRPFPSTSRSSRTPGSCMNGATAPEGST
jgi:Conserved hypothetical protein (DUF2461)